MKQMNTSRRQRSWDLRAAANFIGGGTGTGLLMASVVAAAFGPTTPVTMAAGAVFVMLGLSMVWLEIGKPWRALHVFFHPQTSWMTREGIIAGPLVAAVGAWVVLGLSAALPLVFVLAAGFLFCQARMLRASRGIPAWKQAEVVPFLIATGVAEGTGMMAVLGGSSPALVGFALAAGLAREAAWWAYGRGLARSHAPKASMDVLMKSAPAMACRAAQVAALVLWLATLSGVTDVALLAGLLAAVSGWGIKALLITRAAFTRGPAIAMCPVRGRGIGLPIEA